MKSFLKHHKRAQSRAARGRLVAQLMTRAWRCLPPTNSAEELAKVAALLLATGAGGLTGAEYVTPACETLALRISFIRRIAKTRFRRRRTAQSETDHSANARLRRRACVGERLGDCATLS